ncbi:MAG: Rieske 2Fe-2S domain-containing protein [Gemmatimonadaceae bacterium]
MKQGDDVIRAAPNDTIRAGCEECHARTSVAGKIDRRGFVTHGALAAVGALLLTACGGGSDSTAPGGNTGGGNVGGNGNSGLAVQVSAYPALGTVGGIARVDSGQGTPVAAVRTGATTFAAFSLICPHFGCTVGIVSGSFACPCHGAQFAATGRWTGGQPTGNLTSLNASYDVTTGVLTITG